MYIIVIWLSYGVDVVKECEICMLGDIYKLIFVLLLFILDKIRNL